MPETILIVEDDPLQRKMIASLLDKKLGYNVLTAQNGKEAVNRIKSSNVGEISAVLLDIQMPEMDGFETLKVIKKYRSDIPVLMLTGSDDTDIAVKAIKDGACDFIVKPPDPSHLEIAIKNAIRLSVLSRELARVKRDKGGSLNFSDLIGYDSGLADAVEYGRKAAVSDVPVLIFGETGVGKELFARAIHGESKRSGAVFITVNCSSIPAPAVETILFSTDKGAFRRAEGGTIFLDDIHELPQEAQVKLLRILTSKDIETANGSKPLRVNVRVIAATNHELERAVENGKFRADLYFKLNIVPIAISALRERINDIPLLAEYFIESLSAAEGIISKKLSKEARQYLMQQQWFGNVRELENIIHRALILSDSDIIEYDVLAKIHISAISMQFTERRAVPMLHISLRLPDGRFKTIQEIESEVLNMALNHYDNNITRTADALGIAKSTFYRKIKEG